MAPGRGGRSRGNGEQGRAPQCLTQGHAHPAPPAQVLRSRGYEQLVLQVGRGALEPAPSGSAAVAVESFRFKDSLARDLRRADLVISHAGTAPCVCQARPGAGGEVGWGKCLRLGGGLAGNAELNVHPQVSPVLEEQVR